jgi:LPXTG-motif cell wall-anchored protein
MPQSDVNGSAQSGTATSTDPNATSAGTAQTNPDQNATGTTGRRHRNAAANQAGNTNGNNGTLPQTASELPLLALGGLSTFVSGLMLKLKARKR